MRKTQKKRVYGGMKPLRLEAQEYIPSKPLRLEAQEYIPSKPLRLEAQEYIPSKPLRLEAQEYIPSKPLESGNNLYKGMNALSLSPKANNNIAHFLSEFTALLMKAKSENAVAIDCEMVGVGKENKSALAHVAIADFKGNKIMDKYVIPKEGINAITDYRTQYSGIKPDTLLGLNKNIYGFEVVKDEVHKILDGKMIIGHGLDNDFAVLEYNPEPNMVWDTTKIESYMRNHYNSKLPRKLKNLTKEIAGNIIQNESRNGHSPLEDARASMNLYRISLGLDKITYANMSK